MNRQLWLLAICQGLFLTNNIVFIAINGLVGLALAPVLYESSYQRLRVGDGRAVRRQKLRVIAG